MEWVPKVQPDHPIPLAPPPPGCDLRVLRAIRRIIRAVDLYSKKLEGAFGLTVPQLVCLHTVIDKGPLTAAGISREVHLSPSTLVWILDRLEEKGWIVRERDAADRRQVLVSATEAGRELAVRTPSPLQDRLATALRGLPEAEQETIARSLERVVELMEARDLDASPILETGPLRRVGGEPA